MRCRSEAQGGYIQNRRFLRIFVKRKNLRQACPVPHEPRRGARRRGWPVGPGPGVAGACRDFCEQPGAAPPKLLERRRAFEGVPGASVRCWRLLGRSLPRSLGNGRRIAGDDDDDSDSSQNSEEQEAQPWAESQKQRATSNEQRATSSEQRAASNEQEAPPPTAKPVRVTPQSSRPQRAQATLVARPCMHLAVPPRDNVLCAPTTATGV